MEYKFKVGDCVRRIKYDHPFNKELKIGDVGVVINNRTVDVCGSVKAVIVRYYKGFIESNSEEYLELVMKNDDKV